MPKFYVKCGPIQTILIADSIEQAALSTLDQALQCHLWIYDDPDLSEQDRRDHLMMEALLHLDPTIRVGEQGFDSDQMQLVGTPDMIDRWHKLNVGLNRLFIAAGLQPRSLARAKTWTAGSRLRRPR